MTAPRPASTAADAEAIRGIVEEVVRRIRGEAAAHTAAPGTTGSAVMAPAAAHAGTMIADTVITLGLVDKLPPGTTRLSIAEKAVVTPSARDRAKERGIAIERTAATAAGAHRRPLFVAFADAGPDAAARAAEITRAVPGASRLPATGLADLLASIATHASRDAARAILLTTRCAAAVVLANRAASLRAVTAREATGLLAAANECGANLLVVNPRDLAPTALGRLAAEFVDREMTVPADLAAAPAGCGCKPHPH